MLIEICFSIRLYYLQATKNSNGKLFISCSFKNRLMALPIKTKSYESNLEFSTLLSLLRKKTAF